MCNTIPRCEHPRPDRKRESWLSLNGTWDFEIDNAKVGMEKEFYLRDALEGKITVPFSPESVLSGVGHTDFMHAVWYRKNIEIPKEWAGKRVMLHIDACVKEMKLGSLVTRVTSLPTGISLSWPWLRASAWVNTSRRI